MAKTTVGSMIEKDITFGKELTQGITLEGIWKTKYAAVNGFMRQDVRHFGALAVLVENR